MDCSVASLIWVEQAVYAEVMKQTRENHLFGDLLTGKEGLRQVCSFANSLDQGMSF